MAVESSLEKLFSNKRIILGVTGSIAAYKAVQIASRLTQMNAKVDVILTKDACKFITPLTFQSVTLRPAYVDDDLWGKDGHITHIELGHSADYVLIAPASAGTMAKLANGFADNLLNVTVLASNCPLFISPAMDVGMYGNPATQDNVNTLKSRGAIFIGPVEGRMASGLTGYGRFMEPDLILENLAFHISRENSLKGKKVLVSAGPTIESIDPVRYLSNHSSGKQGFAVARSALYNGAEVTLVHGNTNQDIPAGCKTIKALSAEEMCNAVLEQAPSHDILVMAAAVADFRPANVSKQKVKKQDGFESIPLERTKDILREVSNLKANSDNPAIVIGFAAESQNLLENALEKLKSKNLDMIVANDITRSDSGFKTDTNQVKFIFKDGTINELPLLDKDQVADQIIEQVVKWTEIKD